MRKIFSLFFVLFLTCYCEDGNLHEPHFNPEDFNLLELAEIDGFWQDVSKIDTSFQSGGGTIFGNYPGFIEGISLFDDSNAIRISVFEDQNTAINAMEFRIDNVAILINEGISDSINGLWWFSDDGWNSSVFVNQWNTIIHVLFFNADFEDVETMLYDTANELARRIDDLCG